MDRNNENENKNSRQSRNCHVRKQNYDLQRLSKCLAYLLRYGACKEGLQVDDHGYVDLDELCAVDLLKTYTKDEILNNVASSVSYRNIPRYEWKERDGHILIRAAYLRNFEKNPYHSGTKVFTLYESSINYIINHLDEYDLHDFPEEQIIRNMLRRLKRQKKFTFQALQTLLVPTVTQLDMEDVYLTKKILVTIWTQCLNLVAISLKGCGYLITDNVLNQFVQNLPKLQRLNLCSCTHLTSKCLSILSKWLVHLRVLHITSVPSLTYSSVLNFLLSAHELEFLDVFYLKTKPEEYTTLMETSGSRGIQIILRDPKKKILEGQSECDFELQTTDENQNSEKMLNS